MAEQSNGSVPNSGNRGQENPEQMRDTGNNQNSGNNGTDNVDPLRNFWDNKVTTPENKTPETVYVKEQQNKTPSDEWQEHVKSLGFDDIDLDGIQSDIMEGKTDSLKTAFAAMAEKVYKSSLLTNKSVIDNAVKAAVSEAVSKAVGTTSSNAALEMMHQQLPFTSDAAIEPVAKAVLAKSLKDGKKPAEAIETTRKFFERMQNITAKELNKGKPPRSSSNSDFANMFGDQEEETDWTALLTGTQD
jgi:hypothetical protein